MGFTPALLAFSWKSTAPNRLPWSVIAIAVWPSAASRSNSASCLIAPSSSEYCVCRCRWVKGTCATLLPLDRGRRLRRDVVDDAVHALHLVRDAVRDRGEHVVREPRPVRRHGVRRGDAAERDDVLVGALVAHHA